MTAIVLDSGVLGELLHPTIRPSHLAVRRWLRETLRAGESVVVPEIIDYEYRRKLLHFGDATRVQALDGFSAGLTYEPLTTASMRMAAALWAEARRAGLRTAGDNAIDIDMILIAQWRQVAARLGTDVIIATTNVRHLSRFTDARLWRDIV